MNAARRPGAETADSSAPGTTDAGGRVALLATFTARPGRAAEVESLLLGLTRRVRAEPGNIAFEPCRAAEQPDRFTVWELYRDRAAFEAHIAADYGAVFNRALGPLIIEDGSQLEFLASLA